MPSMLPARKGRVGGGGGRGQGRGRGRGRGRTTWPSRVCAA